MISVGNIGGPDCTHVSLVSSSACDSPAKKSIMLSAAKDFILTNLDDFKSQVEEKARRMSDLEYTPEVNLMITPSVRDGDDQTTIRPLSKVTGINLSFLKKDGEDDATF